MTDGLYRLHILNGGRSAPLSDSSSREHDVSLGHRKLFDEADEESDII